MLWYPFPPGRNPTPKQSPRKLRTNHKSPPEHNTTNATRSKWIRLDEDPSNKHTSVKGLLRY